jgi:hypothetical protein
MAMIDDGVEIGLNRGKKPQNFWNNLWASHVLARVGLSGATSLRVLVAG